MPAFGRHGQVLHGFSTRLSGVAPGQPGDTALVGFLRAARFPAACRGVLLSQVHGQNVWHVREEPLPGNVSPESDAAITRLPGVALAVRTADCVPVLLADADAGVVGVAHAGWRGAVAGVVGNTITALVDAGADLSRLDAAIGPAIGPCCFEVGEDVAASFDSLDRSLVRRTAARPHVDLPAAVELLLCRAGVPAGRISAGAPCTRCRTDLLFSHRGENGRAGRLLSVVALAPSAGDQPAVAGLTASSME